MFVKFVTVLALVAAVSASDVSSFSYDVADPYTGDFKNQFENRVDNNVQGQYSLLESDGTRRVVDYSADARGFNAVVRKDPAVIAPAISYAAPAFPYPAYYSAAFNYGPFNRFGAFPYVRYY